MSDNYSNSSFNKSNGIPASTLRFKTSLRFDPLEEDYNNFTLSLLPIKAENNFVAIIHAVSVSLDCLSKNESVSNLLDKFQRYVIKSKMVKAGSCLEDFRSKFVELIKINCDLKPGSIDVLEKAKKMFSDCLSVCDDLIEIISSNYARNISTSDFLTWDDKWINKLVLSYKQTIESWLNALVLTLIKIMIDSRQPDVVKTAIRTAMRYCRTSCPVSVAFIMGGGIQSLISTCYSLREIAYDAIKLCVLLASNCPFAVDVFLRSGLIECASVVLVYQVEEYSDLDRMEMALVISAITFPDFTEKSISAKPRLTSGTSTKVDLVSVLVGGLVDMCKKTYFDDVFMACVSALANLVIYEPTVADFVVLADALPVIVDACRTRLLGKNIFIKDWVSCLMALIANNQCYHKHMLECDCLSILLMYLFESPQSLGVEADIMATTRVLQKSIVAITKLSFNRGISHVIYEHNGIDRLKELLSDHESRGECDHVRIAAARAIGFIETRIQIDESCSHNKTIEPFSYPAVLQSSVVSKFNDGSFPRF